MRLPQDTPRLKNTSVLAVLSLLLLCGNSGGQSFVRGGPNLLNDGGISAGVSLSDYDNDGHLDLFVANWNDQRNYLYHANGDGTFTRIKNSPITRDPGFSSGGSWGDYDNDGYLDLFVANQQNEHNELFRNLGNGQFARVVSGDIVTDFGNSYAGAWSDYDRDGHLDLFVANAGQPNFLYRNLGDGTFIRIKNGAIATDVAINWTAIWGDYNNDGYPDLFVPSANGQNNLLYRNNGDGTFSKLADGEIVNDGGVSYGSSWGDYDNDGDLDLFVANFLPQGEVQNGLYRNDGDQGFVKIRSGPIVTQKGSAFGGSWGDYDNDGDLDLYVAIWGEPSHLFLNNGEGEFKIHSEGAAVQLAGFPSGHASADVDNDGRLDLITANWDNLNNYIFRNTSPTGQWIGIQLRGIESNRFGVGARISLSTSVNGQTVRQIREINSADALRSQGGHRVHFGLGDASTVTLIRVEWPSGEIDELANVSTNAIITVREGSGIIDRNEPEAASVAQEGIVEHLLKVIDRRGVTAGISEYWALKENEAESYDFGEA